MKTLKQNLPRRLSSSLLLAVCLPTHALTIVRNDDASLAAHLSPHDLVNARAAFDYAAAQFSALYSDPVEINITLAAAPGTRLLGHSSTSLLGMWTYASLRSALIADQTAHPSQDGATALVQIFDAQHDGHFTPCPLPSARRD